MKKQFFLKFWTVNLFIVSVMIVSCSKTSNLTKLIPENAQIVISMDLQSLGQKGKLQDLNKLPSFSLLKETLKNENTKALELLDKLIKDSKYSGIDFSQQAYIYATINENASGALLLALKDASKFESLLKEVCTLYDEPSEKIEKEKNNFVVLDSTMCLGWNNNVAVLFVFDNMDTGDACIEACANLMNGEKIAPLANNKNFKNFADKKKDIGFWMDYNMYCDFDKYSKCLGASTMYNGLDLNGCFVEFCCDFEKDEIKAKTVMHLTDQMKEEFNIFYPANRSFNTKLSDIMPEHTLFVGTVNFEVSEFANWLFNYMMPLLDLSEEEAQEAKTIFKEIDFLLKEMAGSFIFNVSNMENGINPLPLASIAFDIKNSTTPYDYVKNFSVKYETILKDFGTHYEMALGNYIVYIYLNDELGIITTDKSIINHLSSDTKNNTSLTNSSIGNKIKKHNDYLYLDLNLEHYPVWVSSLLADSPSMVTDFLHYYDHIEYYQIGDYDAEMILKMRNVEHNSLYTFLLSIDKVAQPHLLSRNAGLRVQ